MLNKTTKVYQLTCKGFEHEWNDCAVRALAVSAGIRYSESHRLYKAAGRKDRKGTLSRLSSDLIKSLGGVQLRTWKTKSFMTLAEFLRIYPTGRYWVAKSGHAFAVVDGVVHDWDSTSSARVRITHAYALPVTKKPAKLTTEFKQLAFEF